jgi:hypothetical protein
MILLLTNAFVLEFAAQAREKLEQWNIENISIV